MALERNAQCASLSEPHFLHLEDGAVASVSDFFEEQIRLELFSEVTLLAKGRNGVPAQTVYFQPPGSSMDSTASGEVAVSRGAKELGASRTCTAWAQLGLETSLWSMVDVLTG